MHQQEKDKIKKLDELIIARKKLVFQNKEKEKREAELIIANKELAFRKKEKKKGEAELATANYARSLIEASLDPLVTISAEGKITDVNEALIKVTGVSRKNLIGTSFSNYFTEPEKAHEGYRQVFEKGFVSAYPLTIKNKNGKLTDVLYNASIYKDSNGNVLGVFAAARDVTEQKWAIDLRVANKKLAFQYEENEKRAAELAIANKELVFQNNEKERRAAELAIANKELAFQNKEKEKRAVELATANKELVFQNDEKEKRAAELVIANEELAFQNYEKENRAAELVIANKELAFQNEEKEKRAAELVMANEDLNKAEIVIKKLNMGLEKKVMERTAELESANKELESFSYSVSHDLRAPLRAVNGYAQILNEDYGTQLEPEAGRITKNIMTNAKKMGQLIDGLLTFSQLGRKKLVKKIVLMQDMVSHLCNEIKDKENNSNIQFQINELQPSKCNIIAIEQVWVNLISNAVKYSGGKEKPIIEIGSEIKGDEIIYHIKDNGAGFDMRYADKLFGIFQRLHSDEEFEGTGVGLAIVKRLVTKHGGRVWAEGKLNEGAAFYFTLHK
ncbi:MAG: ATP-binding protein [Bacteroidota bacterium]|nr:ATP-binding protein [Bacteroidota bacterium]